MESRFTSLNETQSGVRWLEAHRLLGKYTTAWQCSACGHRYDLSESERLSMQEAGEVPSRIRHQFEAHKCETESRWVRKRPGCLSVQVDDIWTA